MARRSKDDAEKTRERLLVSAAHLFETAGYAATSIDEICARSETTKGALFHHFKSKKDLFLEVWGRLQKEMDAAARLAGMSAWREGDDYSAFLGGCRVYLEWAVRPDYQKIVLLDGPSVLGQAVWHKIDYELGFRNMLTGVRYLAKMGIVEESRIESIAILWQGALNGAGFALSRNPPPLTLDQAYEAFETLVRSAR